MDKDNIQLEWESIQEEIRNNVPEQPSVSVEKQYQSVSQKRLINNNLIELIIAIAGVPFLGFMMLTLESDKIAYLGWIKFSAWFTSVIYLYPVIKLFRQIHYPDPTQQVTEYLQKLVKLMHAYKLYQVLGSFPISFIVIGTTMFFSQAWGRTIDGVDYHHLHDMPAEYLWKYTAIIVCVCVVVSLFISGWAYLMYMAFYKRRRQELKAKLDILLKEE